MIEIKTNALILAFFAVSKMYVNNAAHSNAIMLYYGKECDYFDNKGKGREF